MQDTRVVVVGAGIGGLAAAIELVCAGAQVTLLERAASPGGKLRAPLVAGRAIDSGPTVFTMRWVFDALFEQAGTRLADHLRLEPLAILARHAWGDGAALDLHADPAASADAIGSFAGARDAQGFRDFCARAARIYRTLEQPFLRGQRPNPLSLAWRAGWRGLPDMARIDPFRRMWAELGTHFRDPRLRQLFGRYATYCGSSPFLAPATLMLVAHVEQEGVWSVAGGMRALPEALATLAQRRGVRLRCGEHVAEILSRGGRAAGVRLASGECIEADAVVFNGDPAALPAGALGAAARRATRAAPRRSRSLSALTWSTVAQPKGFALSRHSVFFSDDYAAEFDDLIARRRLPRDPTVYVCAQDRGTQGDGTADTERLLVLVNAPPDGEAAGALSSEEIDECERRMLDRLSRCGLQLRMDPNATLRTTPQDFHRLFPATGGALYGRASHGWLASFQRPAAASRMPGLYLAGGSVHPGPGMPMAALSGRLAAQRLLADRASTHRFHPVAMPGGISTR